MITVQGLITARKIIQECRGRPDEALGKIQGPDGEAWKAAFGPQT